MPPKSSSKSRPAVPSSSLPFAPLKRLGQSLTISNLWLSILSLASKGPVYAYSLPDSIQAAFGFKPSRLMVYLVLYKLEHEKLLRSEADGPRRYYSLTSDGRRCLRAGKDLMLRRSSEL